MDSSGRGLYPQSGAGLGQADPEGVLVFYGLVLVD